MRMFSKKNRGMLIGAGVLGAGLWYLFFRKKGETVLGAGAKQLKPVVFASDNPRSVIILPPPVGKGGGPSMQIENPIRVMVYGAYPEDYLGSYKFGKPSSVSVQYIEKGKTVTKNFRAPKGVEEVYINASEMPYRVG